MKLVALAVILSCCLAHVYCDCGPSEVATVQQQWQASLGSNEAALRQFAVAAFERTVQQYPQMRPPTSAAATAAARRIMHRLSMGISLLNNPAQLEAQLQAVAAQPGPAQNPQIYRAHLQSILALLPQYVGSSYDANAFHCCLTMLVDRVIAAMPSTRAGYRGFRSP